MKLYFAATVLLLLSTASVANEHITPSHVFQKAQQIMIEIEAIREAENITTAAREPGVQINRRPLHVFSKSLEVIEKIGRYQNLIGIDRVNSYNIPLRKVTPKEVYDQAESILLELSRIRKAKGFKAVSRKIPFIAGKGPSDIYKIMWKSSYLLDDLAGQTSPNEVFRNTSYIIEELNLIADELDIHINNISTAQRTDSKTPKDVNLEAFKTLHRVGRLQRYLHMEPFSPTPFPAGIISPNDALDATNTILAELVRVKVALGIKTMRRNLPAPSDKTPDAVFDQMLVVSKSLTPVLVATSSRKPASWAEAALK